MGESTKNIDAIFEEARFSDAILVFDEAEGLFGSRTSMMYVCGDNVYAECGALKALCHAIRTDCLLMKSDAPTRK